MNQSFSFSDIPLLLAFLIMFLMGWLLGRFDDRITTLIRNWLDQRAIRFNLQAGTMSINEFRKIRSLEDKTETKR